LKVERKKGLYHRGGRGAAEEAEKRNTTEEGSLASLGMTEVVWLGMKELERSCVVE
jgi:hypothetical protein